VPVNRTNLGTPATERTVGATAEIDDSGITALCCAVANELKRKGAVPVTSKQVAMLDETGKVKRRFDGNIALLAFFQNQNW
jgi:hypothetical protein